jgi:hypothetical protein
MEGVGALSTYPELVIIPKEPDERVLIFSAYEVKVSTL